MPRARKRPNTSQATSGKSPCLAPCSCSDLQTWKNKLDAAKGDTLKTQEAADMCVLYESLQLAHKCILNRCAIVCIL